MRAIVIGAGISGLTAAVALRDAGADVTVLERRSRPGGRIHTITVNGCTVEAGAHFVTSGYRVVPELAQRVSLEVQHVAGKSRFELADGAHLLRADHPWDAVSSHLLPARASAASLPALRRFDKAAQHAGTIDPRTWARADGVTSAQWAEDAGVRVAYERAWSTAYHGFYFQDPREASGAAIAAMAAHGLRQETWTFRGGLSTLIDRVSGGLDLRLGCPAIGVHEYPDHVEVQTTNETMTADAAVLAVPGPALRGLIPLRPEEVPLADAEYSTALLAVVGIDRRLTQDELDGAYGVLVAPGLGDVAAMAVASRAGHVPEGTDADTITVMFTDSAARAFASDDAAIILERARDEIRRRCPDLPFAQDAGCRVIRIPYAMPVSRPGRVALIEAYRASAVGRRVVVAGDSHAWPWTDSAAAAGLWAADVLRATLTRPGAEGVPTSDA